MKITITSSKIVAILLIIYICSFKYHSSTNIRSKNQFETLSRKLANPKEIVGLSSTSPHDEIVNIDLIENDPLEYLKRKEELIRLYIKDASNNAPNSKNSSSEMKFRFKQDNSKNENSQMKQQTSTITVRPSKIGTIGGPTAKEYNSEEEAVKIVKAESTSNYSEIKDGAIEVYEGNRILSDEGKFWCSAGNHDMDIPVEFIVHFSKSYRLVGMWIHWAFAPGMFKVEYINKNKNLNNPQSWEIVKDWKNTIQSGTINWWKSIIANPKTRWKYKSFDQRIDFDEPVWAKYIKISMKLPVNQYFGIYHVEFYAKVQSVVMLKSKIPGDNMCLSVINGQIVDYSPVMAIDCFQAIAYGDNRELFVIHSNGFITTYSQGKCLESPTTNQVDVVECGKAMDYKDDRQIWILDPDGKIRSHKEDYTCLAVTDTSVNDEIPVSDIRISSSSAEKDGQHDPSRVYNDDTSYWASDPTTSEVVFEIYFQKYPYFLRDMTIDWKYPAKEFKIVGLFPDGFWKVLKKMTNNRETSTFVSLMNKDFMGLKISMTESTTKLNEMSVYGIKSIHLHTGGKFLSRFPCENLIMDSNKFEIIDVNILDKVTGAQYNDSKAAMHKAQTQLKIIQSMYQSIPSVLLRMKEISVTLNSQLNAVSSNFLDFKNRLSKFDVFLQSEELRVFTIGTSKHYPVSDCARIIRSFPSKRSGMYWIKNECMPEAQNVYCDFDSYNNKGGLDYLIFNDNQQINTPFKKPFKSVEELRYACYQLGLEPIEIKNAKMLSTVYSLLKIKDYDLKTNNYVPIAYDYTCDVSKCSGEFKSINDINSSDISDLIKDFIASKSTGINSLLMTTDLDMNSVRNVAAFGKLDIIIYDKLNAINNVAIVCSTNKDGIKVEKNYIDIDCDTNLRSDMFSDYEMFSMLRMLCPSDCMKEKKSLVYGSDIYTDNSSICRASLHSGVIKDEGGFVEVHFAPGRNKYLGSEKNGIASLDYPQKWDKSFTVKKYAPFCPISKMKEFPVFENSFIETKTDVAMTNTSTSPIKPEVLNKNMNELRLLMELRKTIKGYQQMIDNEPELVLNKTHRSLVDNLSKISTFLESSLAHSQLFQNDDEMTSDNSKDSSIVRFMQSNDNKILTNKDQSQQPDIAKRSQLLNSFNDPIQGEEEKKINKFLGFEPNKSEITTEIALNYFTALYTNQLNQLMDLKTNADNIKGTVGAASAEIEQLNSDPDLGVKNQKTRYQEIQKNISKILKIIYEIDRKIQNKLKRTEFKLKEAKMKLHDFNVHEPFVEDYQQKDISVNWEIYNSNKGKGDPAAWDYFQYNIDGHFRVIKQKGGFMDNRSGSHLILQNRNYYDFELRFSVLLKDNNTFGVAFRYKDPYNYYIFEISNKEGGFKRIRRFIQGNVTNIDFKSDGGFLQDTWYNVKIRGVQSVIKIYMTEYNGPNLDKNYELKFEFQDNYLVSGRVAFASQGVSFLLLDNISIVSIACTNFNESGAGKVVILSPSCSRFRETFKNGFTQRWKVIDPFENLDGPSLWKILNNHEDREIVLVQQSRIGGVSDHQEGSIYLLDDPRKICTKGKFILKIKPLDEGIIGLVFRYTLKESDSSSSFYILEISGLPKERYVRIRKKVNEKFILVSVSPLLSYEKNQWMKIMLTVEYEHFNAFITQNGALDNLISVFPNGVVDTDLSYGMMGVSTYQTRAVIDEIILSPFDNLVSSSFDDDDSIFVDEEKLDLPKNKIKDATVFDRINRNIANFTWKKCLKYPSEDDRLRYCSVLFISKTEIALCQNNFCQSCCDKMVDITNTAHNFLCTKQCTDLTMGLENNSWTSCVEPKHPEQSIYPYCDESFSVDFYEKQKCKLDMCNLCCVALEARMNKQSLSDKVLTTCYEQCTTRFNYKPSK